jgi:hypothetical protein
MQRCHLLLYCTAGGVLHSQRRCAACFHLVSRIRLNPFYDIVTGRCAEPCQGLYRVCGRQCLLSKSLQVEAAAAGLASSSTGRNSRAEGPKYQKIWQGFRSADRHLGPETGGVSTKPPAKMHLPSHRGPLVGSWSELAEALPPAGRYLQGELASPERQVLHTSVQ